MPDVGDNASGRDCAARWRAPLIAVLISTAVAWACAEEPEVECESLVLGPDERCPGHCAGLIADRYEPMCNGRIGYDAGACITTPGILGADFVCMVRIVDARVFRFNSHATALIESGHWRYCTDQERSAIATTVDHCEPSSTRTDCEHFDPRDDGGCPEGCFDATGLLVDLAQQCVYRLDRRREVIGCISGSDALPDYACLQPDWDEDTAILIVPRQHEGLPEGWRACTPDEWNAWLALPTCSAFH